MTIAFLDKLSNTGKSGNVDYQLVISKRGGIPGKSEPGTWLHEDIALDFAKWLSIDFGLKFHLVFIIKKLQQTI